MKLYIKNMVSMRCRMAVQHELSALGLTYSRLELGMVELKDDLTEIQLAQLKENLLESGLELINDKAGILIEKIKTIVIEMIYGGEELPPVNYSHYISQKLGYNYNYLANTFSKVKGITLQQFIILLRIEKVKELIFYNEFNLTEIAYKLHYSSVAHLSNQFKKITGLAPSLYRLLKQKRTKNLENL